jgi:16S rRNA (uracil1498-N3)-methyltransferase
MQVFYTPVITDGLARLDEEESRHLLTVLRRKPGDHLQLTDGKGFFYEAELVETGKKHAVARVITAVEQPLTRAGRLHIAIAPTKQIERFEWFLEKATEIGVDTITPLHCQRSERVSVRADRLEKIILSAMKQSLRARLPELRPMTLFGTCVKAAGPIQKRIAWCDDQPMPHLQQTIRSSLDALILIGPEGDFSPEEVQLALGLGFEAISLGAARLRTETAGIMAAAIYNLAGN